MVIIRPTLSLANRMKVKINNESSGSDTALGDWSANVVTVDRIQLIVSVCENARLAIVRKAAPFSNWTDRFMDVLKELLLSLDIKEKSISEELTKMQDIRFAKTNNRSVVSSLNDFIRHVEYAPYCPEYWDLNDLLKLSKRLSIVPTGVSGKYLFPEEEVIKILG